MPKRISIVKTRPKSVTALRKSPRLHLKDQNAPGDLKTTDCETRASRFTFDPSPLSSANKGSGRKTHTDLKGKTSKKIQESKCVSNGSKDSEQLNAGLRRSATPSSGVFLRRSPRFSGQENIVDECFGKEIPDRPKRKGLSSERKMEVGLNSSKQAEGKNMIEKRVTRSSVRGNSDEVVKKKNKGRCAGFLQRVSFQVSDKEGLPDVERAEVGAKSCNHIRDKLKRPIDEDSLCEEKTVVVANTCSNFGENLGKSEEEVKERVFDIGTKVTGVKRKRNHGGEGHGWTKDQELALQRAYFAAKPTPNFWKKVAKLVPGKSAKDCFNKVHADHLTPQPRTRLRESKANLSSFSLSASPLLKIGEPKIRRITGRKQKGHLAQKTVRQLLQKHYSVNQGYEADLFSVLESTFNPSTESVENGVTFCTPQCEQGKSRYLNRCYDKSSSAHKKQFSRLNSSNGAALVSPPVLKPIKNKVLHEKYIDQLHCREAKRRVASSKENRKEDYNQKIETIKVVKDALVLDAKDIIHKFQHRKDNERSEHSDDDDENEGVDADDDEEEDEL